MSVVGGAGAPPHPPQGGGDSWPSSGPSPQPNTSLTRIPPTGPAIGAWELPGTTDEPHPTCGRPKRGASCQAVYEAGQTKFLPFTTDAPSHVRRVIVMSCGRPGCRTCWASWARRAADRVAERIEECVRVAREARVPGGGEVKHWAFSPPPVLVAQIVARGGDVEKELREELRRILLAGVPAPELGKGRRMASGFVGGVDIFHPWRVERDAEGRALAHGPDKYRQGRNVFSPHFHVLGVGHVLNTDVFYARTGWVVKNKGVRRSVAATVAYLLEHAGVRKRARPDGSEQSVPIPRWSGSMSTRRVVLDTETSSFEAMECDCGALLVEHPLDAHGEVDWARINGNAYAVVRKRRYRLARARSVK